MLNAISITTIVYLNAKFGKPSGITKWGRGGMYKQRRTTPVLWMLVNKLQDKVSNLNQGQKSIHTNVLRSSRPSWCKTIHPMMCHCMIMEQRAFFCCCCCCLSLGVSFFWDLLPELMQTMCIHIKISRLSWPSRTSGGCWWKTSSKKS